MAGVGEDNLNNISIISTQENLVCEGNRDSERKAPLAPIFNTPKSSKGTVTFPLTKSATKNYKIKTPKHKRVDSIDNNIENTELSELLRERTPSGQNLKGKVFNLKSLFGEGIGVSSVNAFNFLERTTKELKKQASLDLLTPSKLQQQQTHTKCNENESAKSVNRRSNKQ